MSDYKPISCSVYDQLEALAVQRREVTLQFTDASGAEQLLTTGIKDLQTRDSVEYLITSSGIEIRLDRLHFVNQMPVSGSCAV